MTTKIESGRSLERSVGFADNINLAGWTCRLQIRDIQTAELMLDRSVSTLNSDSNRFTTIITYQETISLVANRSYVLAFELTNAATGQRSEVREDILVTSDWVYD